MVGENSRYVRTPLYNRDDEVPMLGIRERFVFNTDLCLFHTWMLGDSLDRLSYTYYGTSELRWAILDANPQYRSEFEIEIGQDILIPDIDEIMRILNTDGEYDEDDSGYVDEYDAYEDADYDD